MERETTILNVSSGHIRFFEELYLRYYDKIKEYLIRLSNSSVLADDICQEVFMKLWQKHDLFSQIEDFGCYLYRSAKNEFIDHLRKQKNRQRVIVCLEIQCEVSNMTQEIISQREMEAILQQAIQRLSPRCKKVYLLGKIEGFPLDKVARILGVSHQTVKNQIRDANVQVRKFVNERMGPDRTRQRSSSKAKKHHFSDLETLKAA